MNKAIKNDRKIAVVDTIQDPAIPIKRPNKKHEIKLKKGKIIIHKYIKKLKKQERKTMDDNTHTMNMVSHSSKKKAIQLTRVCACRQVQACPCVLLILIVLTNLTFSLSLLLTKHF